MATLFAFAAHSNPIDTDNDYVLDEDDNCPTVRGSPCHDGCPAPPGEECVTVTGTRSDIWSVGCSDGSIVTSWLNCSGFAGWTQWRTGYYDPNTGRHLYTDTTTRETDEEEDEEEEVAVAAEVDCNANPRACWTPGHWVAHCTILEQMNTPHYLMPSQCEVQDIPLDALYEKLQWVASEYPRTTCVTGAVLSTGASIVVARIRNKESAKLTWVLVSTTGIACAAVMEIYL